MATIKELRSRVGQWSKYLPENTAILNPYFLAIIQNESKGFPGQIASRTTRYTATIPSELGVGIATNRALGLMQVIPINIVDYNSKHPGKEVTYEQMTGTSSADGVKQIETGLYVFFEGVDTLERILGQQLIEPGNRLNLNLLKLALVTYAWGIGNLREKLDVLTSLGLDPSYENLAATFPDLGNDTNNQPLVYTQKIMKNAQYYKGVQDYYFEPGVVPGIEPEMEWSSLMALFGVVLWAFKQ